MTTELGPHSDRFVVGLSVRSYNWRMRQARRAKGWTQADLAAMAQVSIPIVQHLESLKRDYTPNWDLLDLLADILEQPLSTLFPAWLRVKSLKLLTDAEVPLPITADMAGDDDLLQRSLQGELEQRISVALESLSLRQRSVVEWRFGFDNGHPKTLKEVASKIGCTGDHIRQIEAQALKKLRRKAEEIADVPTDTEGVGSAFCPGSGRIAAQRAATGSVWFGVCRTCGMEMRLEGEVQIPNHDRPLTHGSKRN